MKIKQIMARLIYKKILCLELKVAALIFAYLFVAVKAWTLFWNVCMLIGYILAGYDEKIMKRESYSDLIELCIFAGLAAVVTLADVIFGILGIVGVHKERNRILKIFIKSGWILLALGSIIEICFQAEVLRRTKFDLGFFIVIIWRPLLHRLFHAATVLVIRSFYYKLKYQTETKVPIDDYEKNEKK